MKVIKSKGGGMIEVGGTIYTCKASTKISWFTKTFEHTLREV